MPTGIPFNNPAADARIIEMWNAGQVPREIADDLVDWDYGPAPEPDELGETEDEAETAE